MKNSIRAILFLSVVISNTAHVQATSSDVVLGMIHSSVQKNTEEQIGNLKRLMKELHNKGYTAEQIEEYLVEHCEEILLNNGSSLHAKDALLIVGGLCLAVALGVVMYHSYSASSKNSKLADKMVKGARRAACMPNEGISDRELVQKIMTGGLRHVRDEIGDDQIDDQVAYFLKGKFPEDRDEALDAIDKLAKEFRLGNLQKK